MFYVSFPVYWDSFWEACGSASVDEVADSLLGLLE